MKILGIDPGSLITGYGVVEKHQSQWKHVTFGCLKAPSSAPLSQRLLKLHRGVEDIIEKIKPDAVAIENVFFHKNASSALKLGQTRGALILAASQAKLPLYEYTPLQVKQAITGYGQATKEQVQKMIIKLLSLQEVPPVDASDALAIALCHAHNIPQLAQMRAGA